MPSTFTRPRLLAGAATLIAAVAVLAGCTTGAGSATPTVTVTTDATGTSNSPGTTAPATSTSPSPTVTTPTGAPVHIQTLNADGAQYGVGMPLIAYFSKKITDARPLQAATKVTVNGAPLAGAWYFEYSSAKAGYPIEGHWRPQVYWQAHSAVHVDLPTKGLSAGTGLVYDDSLTVDFTVGASHIATVDDTTHMMTIVSDGKPYGTFPVSLGNPNVASMNTLSGIKVIMEKLPTVCMRDFAHTYNDCGIKDDQRLTYSGEYLHSAPWNCVDRAKGCDANGANHIGHLDSSNGCTNLMPTDAKQLYGYLEIGDVVRYFHTTGHKMQLGEGYGDWNVPWTQWQTGGLARTV